MAVSRETAGNGGKWILVPTVPVRAPRFSDDAQNCEEYHIQLNQNIAFLRYPTLTPCNYYYVTRSNNLAAFPTVSRLAASTLYEITFRLRFLASRGPRGFVATLNAQNCRVTTDYHDPGG